MMEPHVEPAGPARSKKTFVLCFDGTGNKFSGDETDSNILKIYRMLDRGDGSTFTFYQPGMGTYVSSNNLQTTGLYSRIKSWYIKSKDAAVGSSFAEHVMGGYRFLMRYYSTEDDLYFFGFSRGAYTARFLAEMLDHVGLLSAGNEELTRFAWKTYAKWAGRRIGNSEEDKQKERDLYNFMRGFRETFSRRVRRIRFLGLFDTVNSVPAFENAWMQRSKFPYTAKSSAKLIRHAVSIDERRAKFRQDLICGSKKDEDKDEPKSGIHRYQSDLPTLAKHANLDQYAGTTTASTIVPDESVQDNHPLSTVVASIKIEKAVGSDTEKLGPLQHDANPSLEHFEDALEHSDKLEVVRSRRSMSFVGDYVTRSTEDLSAWRPQAAAYAKKHSSRRWSEITKHQDIQEVWFPGGHGDIGGGWKKGSSEKRMVSHVPLVWMVQEAEKAGLRFDPMKMEAANCCPDKINDWGERESCQVAEARYHLEFENAVTEGIVHDCLLYGGGLPRSTVAAWKLMEYLPFRRMDLQKDGSWKAIAWPLPFGETRDIPLDAEIHCSVIRRMQHDPNYRPGNLIVGGGGRGVRIAPKKYGTGEWEPSLSHGHKIGETFVRKKVIEGK